jgi:hypothetical protein
MTPYRVSARQDATARDRDEALAFSRSVRAPMALPAAAAVLAAIALPAALYWYQWLCAGRCGCTCFF